MATQEQENFYHHSTVIVDETKDSFLHLLEFSLTNQGITLQRFIEINAHVIYHMFSRYPCCQCPPYMRTAMSGSRVLQQQQLDILLDPGGDKLPGHNRSSKSAPHCCSPVNPNLQLQSLDFTLARLLLVSFTDIVPNGSDERNALDNLVKIRNESFAHAKNGRIPNDEYRKSMEDIEKSLLVLAKIYGKEAETKQRLKDIGKQPYNTTLCLHLQNTLIEQQNILLQQCQLNETIKRLLAEKSLPEYLSKDLEDIRVVEGCDAKLELWTKESGVNVEWFKGDIRIEQSNKFMVKSSCLMHSLIVTNADLTDRGIYYAKIMESERMAKIDIEEYFTKNLQSVECIEGEIAEFTCEVKEHSLPAHWNKNGERLKNDGKYEMLQAGKLHRLCINNCDLHDTAKYTVNINNRIRETSLVVIEYFTKPLATMTCIEGETVQFDCEVLEDNQTAVWFKDDTEVSTSDKYHVERQGKLHRLVVNNTGLDDNGEYSVKIKHCVRQSQLIVQEYFTKALDTQTCIEGEDVQFECEVLGNNQTAVWFKDGTAVDTSVKYKVERHGGLHRLVVINTKLADMGEYLVKIKNCVRHSKLIVQGLMDDSARRNNTQMLDVDNIKEAELMQVSEVENTEVVPCQNISSLDEHNSQMGQSAPYQQSSIPTSINVNAVSSTSNSSAASINLFGGTFHGGTFHVNVHYGSTNIAQQLPQNKPD